MRPLHKLEQCGVTVTQARVVPGDNDATVDAFRRCLLYTSCVARAQEVHPALSEDEVKKLIRKTDKRRADYYQYFTGRNWKDADNYDLCINSSQFGWNSNSGWEKCVALVKAYLEIMLG